MVNKLFTPPTNKQSQYDNSAKSPDPQAYSSYTLTILQSLDAPMTKAYFIDREGKLSTSAYQNAFKFNAHPVDCGDICHLATILKENAKHPELTLIRGLPMTAQLKGIRRKLTNFAEHPEGTPWVMIDIDGIPAPEGISPISHSAIEWLVSERLPAPFQTAKGFYQFSSSAGICKPDGTPLKDGIRVHLFYYFDRRITGQQLEAYLGLHCLDTGFFELGYDKGKTPIVKLGIDLAMTRPVQVHYFALPIIKEGVTCQLSAEQRFGWVNPEGSDVVTLPPQGHDLPHRFLSIKAKALVKWKVENGYKLHLQTFGNKSGLGITKYYAPANPADKRGGRTLTDHKQSPDGNRVILHFDDENTPGSWYVLKVMPQLARRFGDGETMPLKELSTSAYAFVRDELTWFFEVPHQQLSLTEQGYLPAFNFATAKNSLVISPTGSGKTHQVIDYIRGRISNRVVVYVAQTIPLVNQMAEDLADLGIQAIHYQHVNPEYYLPNGIVVTTNESLPKVLAAISPNSMRELIIDEVHRALDDFASSEAKLRLFESAISGSSKVLYLTGTLTPVQRLMLTETIRKMNGGALNEALYCCYEFAPVKQYPLYLVPSSEFNVDVVRLLEHYGSLLKQGETIPRTVMLMDTSSMETYRVLIEQYGLGEVAEIVSRPEAKETEVEAARRSSVPILISSPLFSIGLNFEAQPAILWCKVSNLKIDTSQIVQTINRGNRGEVECHTRLYHGNIDEEPFYFPPHEELAAELTAIIEEESSIPMGDFNLPQMIERLSYNSMRDIERTTTKAMGELVRENGFQNHVISSLARDAELTPDAQRAARIIMQEAKGEARATYEAMPDSYLAKLSRKMPFELPEEYQRLKIERKENFRKREPRVEREIEAEEIAISMALTGGDYAEAKKVDPHSMATIWAQMPPWISARYRPEHSQDTNLVYAEKLAKIADLIEVISAWQKGAMGIEDLARKLTKDQGFGDAFMALSKKEQVYVSRMQSLEEFKQRAQDVRSSGGRKQKKELSQDRLEFLADLLATIGINFERVPKERGKGTTIDYKKPKFPATWDFERIAYDLRKFSEMMKSLPEVITFPVTAPLEVVKCGHPDDCLRCKFMHNWCCAKEHTVDFGEWGIGDSVRTPDNDCGEFEESKVGPTLPAF